MISLVPSWAQNYDEFWVALRNRNLWFIKLRFGAALMLAAFIFSAEFILGFRLTIQQEAALVLITISIVLYNFLFIYLRGYIRFSADKFNPLHLSLMQMLLDLIALFLLCYYTGSIESPLFMLFIFHMIIGSLVLPGSVVYSIAAATILIFSGIIYFEYFGIIAHHSVSGLLHDPMYMNIAFISSYLTVFAFVIIMTVVITNRIANELYRMEQQLIESLHKIESAETEKQKYIMGMVHEIKTPLSAVHSFLDIILQKFLGPLNDKVEEKLNRARSRSQEAISLIDDILKVSRIKLLDEITLEDIDVREIVCQLSDKQLPNIQKKAIKMLINDIRGDKSPIKGDRFLLEIALSNLINNAVKYTGYNGRVEVELNNASDKLVITVSDSGVGIPPEDINRVFNDFYRASNIRHKEYNGTGMGLTIVKQILQRHLGEISVKSPSKFGTKSTPGTSFTVTLPILRPESK
jgi:signal transduction histidine kinase